MAKSKKKSRKAEPLSTRAAISSVVRTMPSGRVTVDSVQDVFTSSLRVLTPFSSDQYWKGYRLDQKTLDRVPIWKLVELLIDLSPDVSKGIWDWQRLFNPGYEVTAYKLKSKEDVKDERAQLALDTFLSQLHGPYSVTNQVPANVVINTVSMQAFLRGGMFAELVLDSTGKMPLEIATPDPQTIGFLRIDDAERGKVWQLGQRQGIMSGSAGLTPLDRPTVVYLPVDPLPGKPFGRALISPAIFATLFLIGLLHDLRRVVAQQGYPRLDLVIDSEKLQAMMPTSIQGDAEALKSWVAATITEIENAYQKLQPDDAFVHLDDVTVNAPVAAASGTNLTGLTGMDGIIKALESMAAKALKSAPFGAGEAQGSETNSNRQYEFHIQCIKAIQHNAENLFERLLTFALQVQGLAARVEFRFSENRAAEELRDQQSLFLKLRNARTAYDNGLISQDEQALMALNKQKADQTEPRAAASNIGGQVASINADPGSQRFKVTDPKHRNLMATLLLMTSSNHPTEIEITDAIEFFNAAIPGASGILEPEAVN